LTILKNQYQRYFILSLFLLLGLFSLTSCQMKNTPQESVITDPTATQLVVPTLIVDEYPSTPEEVIRAFLIAYPMDQLNSIQYLSPSYLSTLDAASISNLLPASGDITGFIIEKGVTSTELGASEILANVAFESMSSEVQFNLGFIDGRWVINQIYSK